MAGDHRQRVRLGKRSTGHVSQESPPGRSASWATSCCSRSSSACHGGAFDTPQQLDLWGQAGRQVFFIIVSVYGWVRWYQYRKSHAGEGVGVRPRWAGANGRLQLLVGALALTTIFYFVLRALGSWGPLADAWILTGSILATYGMARGWVEFWLIWIAVDLVGVPLLLLAGYYPSAIMYIVYGVFCVVGFMAWLRIERRERAEAAAEGVATPEVETVG